MRTEIIIRATRTANVLGEKGRRIRELTTLVQRRFQMAEGSVELYAERVQQPRVVRHRAVRVSAIQASRRSRRSTVRVCFDRSRRVVAR